MCASLHLDVVPDEAVFERGSLRVLDGEVPTAEDLVAHVHTVMLPEHPGVLVADRHSTGGSVQI